MLARAGDNWDGTLPPWRGSVGILTLFLKCAEYFQNSSMTDEGFFQIISGFFQFHNQIFHSLTTKIMIVSNCSAPPALMHSLLSEAFFFSHVKKNHGIYPQRVKKVMTLGILMVQAKFKASIAFTDNAGSILAVKLIIALTISQVKLSSSAHCVGRLLVSCRLNNIHRNPIYHRKR